MPSSSLLPLPTWERGKGSACKCRSFSKMADRRVRSNLVFALINGGPRTLFFGMIIAVIVALAQAACLGEMASMIPFAGAQYHWTFHMAPKRIKMFATWIQGWTTWFGYVALQAALANILVVQLESLITLNSETYVAGGWKTSVLVIACAVFQGLVNVYAFRVIPWLEMISSILYIGLLVLVLVVFVVMVPSHEASLLLKPMIASGWDHNPYVSWHLGMLTCIFSITGTVTHYLNKHLSFGANVFPD